MCVCVCVCVREKREKRSIYTPRFAIDKTQFSVNNSFGIILLKFIFYVIIKVGCRASRGDGERSEGETIREKSICFFAQTELTSLKRRRATA